MGLELLHHLGIEARDIHGAAGRQAQQYVADLLCDIDRNVFLGLFGGGTQMGRED